MQDRPPVRPGEARPAVAVCQQLQQPRNELVDGREARGRRWWRERQDVVVVTASTRDRQASVAPSVTPWCAARVRHVVSERIGATADEGNPVFPPHDQAPELLVACTHVPAQISR